MPHDRTLPRRRRLLRRLATSLVALGLAFAVGAGDLLAEGTLRIGRPGDSTIFDPILISQSADFEVAANLNAMLVRNNAAATGVEPDLAERWEVSPDGLVYRFHLRPSLAFSDGSPIRASDVKFSLERLRDTPDAVFAAMVAPIVAIDTPDARTVVITLSRPTAPFLPALALLAAAVLPEAAIRNRYDAFLTRPIGAGAFRLVEWRPGRLVALERNPQYWEAPRRPRLDRVEWHTMPNPTTRLVKLRTGEIDAATDLPFDRIAGLQDDPTLMLRLEPSRRETLLLLNHARPPLDDLRVRQAICQAIDRRAIAATATAGIATPTDGFIPTGSPFANPDRPDCAYDPAEAKRLLSEAGVDHLRLKLPIAAGDAPQAQIATLLRDQLATIGIAVEIETQEIGQAWETVRAGGFDLAIDEWTDDTVDPDQKTSFALGGDAENLSYFTRYRNPAVSSLIDEGRSELDPEKRKAIYDRIREIAKQDVPWIDLYYTPYRNVSRSDVRGFAQNPLGRLTIEDTEIVP